MVNPEFDIRPTILVGDTADVSFQRTLTVLRNEGINPIVTMEFSPAVSKKSELCWAKFSQRLAVRCGLLKKEYL